MSNLKKINPTNILCSSNFILLIFCFEIFLLRVKFPKLFLVLVFGENSSNNDKSRSESNSGFGFETRRCRDILLAQ